MANSTLQWEKFIRQTAASSEQVVFTMHALSRMRERHLTRLTVLDVLRKGRIHRVPEPNASKGTTECRMEYFVAGRHVGVVAAVAQENPQVIVVTAMEIS